MNNIGYPALRPWEERHDRKTGPSVQRGSSKQDYRTPEDFMEAVRGRFFPPSFDLAADASNTQVQGTTSSHKNHFDEQDDSLTQQWHKLPGLLWLNPPFSNIEPWAKKCLEEKRLGAQILLLVPASVGSVWFSRNIHNESHVYFLSPRLSFDSLHPYPKDLILCHFGGVAGYTCWRWK